VQRPGGLAVLGEVEYDDQTMSGITVFTGHRVMVAAPPGEVLVSNTVKDLVAGSV